MSRLRPIDYINPQDSPPRSRRRWVIGIATAVTIAAIAYSILAPSLWWSGGVVTDVDVQVFDATNGNPIAGALVVALASTGAPSRFSGSGPVATDSGGNARIRMMVGAGGKRSWGYDRYRYGGSLPIQVSAAGFSPTNVMPGTAGGLKVLGIKWQPRLSVRIGLQPAATTRPY